MTYLELERLSNRAANALIGLGVQKGDHVALLMTNSEKFPISYFGILKAGAVVVPINTKFTGREVEYILENSDSSYCIFSSDMSACVYGVKETLAGKVRLIAVGPHVPGDALSMDQLIMDTTEEKPARLSDEEDLCTILYTSGTTGNLCGALFNHRFSYNTRNLIMMPLFHSAPLHNHMLGTFWVGGTVVLLPSFDCCVFLETIPREKITHFFGPALVYLTCVNHYDVKRYDLSSIQLFVMGGSPCAAKDQKRAIREMDMEGRFMQVYGLTESGPFGSALLPEDIQRKPNSIGLNGSIGAELVIVDCQFNQVSEPGVVGELAIFAESHMLGYYKNPEKTKATLVNGWIMSGDLAMYDEDGYICFVGQFKDMIISGGQNGYPKEVEDVIMRCPGVMEAAVIGIPNVEWGETVKAVLTTIPGHQVTPDEIKQFVTDRLAKFKRPRYVEIVRELPHNPAGKILKTTLRETCGEARDFVETL